MIYGRRPRQLLIVWGFALLIMGLLFWFEFSAPAFHELLLPVYWLVFLVAVVFTWRWFRARSAKDRRGKDRRHAERRNHDDSTSS